MAHEPASKTFVNTPRVLIAVASASVALHVAAEAPTYRITQLPQPIGTAHDLNNIGQVAAVASGPNGNTAVIWSESAGVIDVGTIAGLYSSRALAINDDGIVGGIAADGPTPPFDRGFLYDPTRGAVLTPGLPTAGGYGLLADIADSGRATGHSGGHAVIWNWGATIEVTDLGSLSGAGFVTNATSINNHGDVAGYGSTADGNRAFVWTPESGFVNLGVLPGFTFASIANDVNDIREVVGSVQASPSILHAFLWNAAEGMKDLGELPGGQEFGEARAINNLGQIVGYSTVEVPAGADPGRAVLWQGGAIYNLNELIDPDDPLKNAVLLTQANGINDSGQIVGVATNLTEGRSVGFLLTPINGFKFEGFNAPVDNLPIVNKVKAGRGVPVKWRLSDGRGGYLSDLATFKSLTSQASSCVSGTPASDIEEISTTGSSGLHFDQSTNEFVFVWKTSSSWKNRCRTLILELADGQRQFASFQFR